MEQKVVDFLTSERMSVMAVDLPSGTPHASAMHFVYHDAVLYFCTHSHSRKLAGLMSGSEPGSVVVGFSEADWVTVQLDGQIQKIDSPVEKEEAKRLILAKYPESSKYMDESAVFLKFTPTWYRYTDFKTTPPTIISSGDNG